MPDKIAITDQRDVMILIMLDLAGHYLAGCAGVAKAVLKRDTEAQLFFDLAKKCQERKDQIVLEDQKRVKLATPEQSGLILAK